MEENLFSLNRFKMTQEKEKTIQLVKDKKLHMYESNFRSFEKFCEDFHLPVDFDSLELFYMNRLSSSKNASK